MTRVTKDLSRDVRKPAFWFPTLSDTNQAILLQKMARGLKVRIEKVEGLHYLCRTIGSLVFEVGFGF